MIKMNQTPTLIRASVAYQKWRGNNEERPPNYDAVNKWLEESGLKVHAHFPTAKGVSRFLNSDEVAAWIAANRRPEPVPAEPPAKGELHLAALETKIDRLNDQVKGLEQAINVLIKSQNLWVEDLRALVNQLK